MVPSKCCQIFALSSTRTVRMKFGKYFFPMLCACIHNNGVTTGLVKMSDDVGSMFEKMSRLLETVNDAQEKERLMIGMTGVPDKDILNRFVRTRFIPRANCQQTRAPSTRSRQLSVIFSRVAVQFVEVASDLWRSTKREYKFTGERKMETAKRGMVSSSRGSR